MALNFDEDAPTGDSSDEGEGKSGGGGGRVRPGGGRIAKEGSVAAPARDARPVSVGSETKAEVHIETKATPAFSVKHNAKSTPYR